MWLWLWLFERSVPFDDIGLLDCVLGVEDGVDEGVLDFYVRAYVFMPGPTCTRPKVSSTTQQKEQKRKEETTTNLKNTHTIVTILPPPSPIASAARFVLASTPIPSNATLMLPLEAALIFCETSGSR